MAQETTVNEDVPEGKLRLEVVTTKGIALSVLADEVTAPGVQGEFGVLPGHLPLLAALRPGIVTYRVGAESHRVAVSGGFAEVEPLKVSILAAEAAKREAIDPVQVRKRLGEVDAAIHEAEAAAAASEEAGEKLPALIREENWLAAQLELYGDPPPAALRPFEEFGPTPLPADEDDEAPPPGATGGAA